MIPRLRAEYGGFDFVIANGENSAAGFGLTEKVMRELFASGIDVLTNGNHVWDKKDFIPLLDSEPNVLRPANHPKGTQGRGFAVYEKNGEKLAVLCLQGRVFMPPLDCPFQSADAALANCAVPALFVDIHAAATSENRARGICLGGRGSGVVGGRPGVRTADEEIMPGGTAFLSDAGMTGGHGGVIGMTADSVLSKFLMGTPSRFAVCEERVSFQGVIVEIESETGRAIDVKRIDVPVEV